jgi:FixJ family two-component response regulator
MLSLDLPVHAFTDQGLRLLADACDGCVRLARGALTDRERERNAARSRAAGFKAWHLARSAELDGRDSRILARLVAGEHPAAAAAAEGCSLRTVQRVRRRALAPLQAGSAPAEHQQQQQRRPARQRAPAERRDAVLAVVHQP